MSTTTVTPWKPIEISLTSFADFVLKTGMTKLSVVERIAQQYQEGYKRYKDYYGPFREAVCAIHKQGRPVFELNQLPPLLQGPDSKRANYESMVRGHMKFWASNYQESACTWTKPAKGTWTKGGLRIRINPELGFINGDETHLIKMYLKKEPPGRKQVRLILHLMQMALRPKVERPVIGFLDVRRGRLFQETAFDPRLSILIEGEAAGFVQMHRALQSRLHADELDGDSLY